MKRMMACALLVVLSLVGCNRDVQGPEQADRVTLNTAMGDVVVEDVTRDLNAKRMTARVVGSQIDANLQVSSSSTGENQQVVTATLTDADGNLLYMIEETANTLTGELIYREATEQDYLEVGIHDDEQRTRETYDADGDVAIFEYPSISEETKSRALNLHEHGLPTDHLPADITEYVHQAEAFETYYLPHTSSTIHNNPDGELLVQVLTSPEVSQLVIGGDDDPQRVLWVQNFCMWANACTAFSCRIAPTHPVCAFCTVASWACTIIQLVCSWFGCA
ncbi:MAG TPA: hypothetical protein VFH88_09355 [Candidatus Krumholzibacteria bacterium]|nr:hypothetical protein [Candidatus Krumholzibacteria bacterium]